MQDVNEKSGSAFAKTRKTAGAVKAEAPAPATPLWRVQRESDGDMYEAGYDFSAPGDCTYYTIMEGSDPAAIIFAEADSAATRRKNFVLTACNSHSALVEALREMLRDFGTEAQEDMDGADVISRARAALALAQEQ